MRANGWTTAEEAWLREVYPHSHNSEIADMHAQEFPDRPRRTSKAINSRARKLHLLKADGFVRNPPVFWTPEKDAWFRSFVPGHSESEISAEHERIYGTPLSEGQIGNRKTYLGVKSGTVGGHFRKGQAPFNKGKKWTEYGTPEGHERSRATQFKRGEVHGYAAQRMQPVGAERISKDGYIEVKVSDGLQDKPNCNFRKKHHVVYEQAYGPIPSGCNIVFADHDKRNLDPGNLVAVPRSVWSVISHNRMEYWDAESLRACMAVAQLDMARYAAQNRPRECRKCGAEFVARFPSQRTCDACLGR